MKHPRNPILHEDVTEICSEAEDLEEILFRNKDDLKDVLRLSHVDELTQEVVDAFISKIKVY